MVHIHRPRFRKRLWSSCCLCSCVSDAYVCAALLSCAADDADFVYCYYCLGTFSSTQPSPPISAIVFFFARATFLGGRGLWRTTVLIRHDTFQVVGYSWQDNHITTPGSPGTSVHFSDVPQSHKQSHYLSNLEGSDGTLPGYVLLSARSPSSSSSSID